MDFDTFSKGWQTHETLLKRKREKQTKEKTKKWALRLVEIKRRFGSKLEDKYHRINDATADPSGRKGDDISRRGEVDFDIVRNVESVRDKTEGSRR